MDSLNSAAFDSRLVAYNIDPNCLAVIVLPVRNEAELLAENLESLTYQISGRRFFEPKLFEIIVFANNCQDHSAEIARCWQRKNRHLKIHVAEADIRPENSNIGYVRRCLMNEAYQRLRRTARKSGVILTTDADTKVAPNWLAANLEEIKNGADAVGGRILIDRHELDKMHRQARRFHLFDTAYRLLTAEIEARLDYVSHDYLPRHHQHFNGSFAVTTEAFARAGGVPDVRFLEDVAFYQSLLRVDARVRHSPLVRVQTSARRDGRTESGLSTQINEWAVLGENGEKFLVESAVEIEERFHLRKNLRGMWNDSRRLAIADEKVSALAERFLIAKNFLRRELDAPQTFGSLYEKVTLEQSKTGEWAKKYVPVEIEKTLFDLRGLAHKLRKETVSVTQNQIFVQTSSR